MIYALSKCYLYRFSWQTTWRPCRFLPIWCQREGSWLLNQQILPCNWSFLYLRWQVRMIRLIVFPTKLTVPYWRTSDQSRTQPHAYIKKIILCTNKNKSTNQHSCSDSNICYNFILYVLIVIDMEHKLGGNVGGSEMLF